MDRSHYLLANAVCQSAMAALTEAFGATYMSLSSVSAFTAGSVIRSLAGNVPTMSAGRVIQGIGGSGILSINLIILSILVPLRYRPKYQLGRCSAY